MVRHAEDVPVRDPAGALAAGGVGGGLGAAAERDAHLALRVGELPRVAEGQPGVGHLHLSVVLEGLAEDPVLVADAVPDARDVHRGERVDEAGGEASEATVAEPGLDLLGAQGGDVDAALVHRDLGDVLQVRREQVVAELAAEEVLGREVADGLLLGLATAGPGAEPVGHEVAAHGAGQRQVLVVDRRLGQLDALAVVELGEEGLDEAVDRGRGLDDRSGRERVRGPERRTDLPGIGRGGLVGHESGLERGFGHREGPSSGQGQRRSDGGARDSVRTSAAVAGRRFRSGRGGRG